MAQISGEWLEQSIRFAIATEVKRIVAELIEKAKEELDQKAPAVIAGTVVDVMKMAELQTFQDRIVFTIRKQ